VIPAVFTVVLSSAYAPMVEVESIAAIAPDELHVPKLNEIVEPRRMSPR
jgi:hypothetical protein